MGRRKQWTELMVAKFAAGTFERIAAVLRDKEERTEFVRVAVDAELRRREGRKVRSGPSKNQKQSDD